MTLLEITIATSLMGLVLSAAVLVGRGWRPAAWAVVGLPILPVTLAVGHAVGLPVPVAPDPAMFAVLGLQLLAAGLALRWLRAERVDQRTN